MDTLKGKQIIVRITYIPSSFNGEGLFFCPFLNSSLDIVAKNGLLSVKRKQNGYRIYTDEDIKRLKIIRSLRCANYSLEAILRMIQQLSQNPNVDIRKALNTPKADAEIITVCDKLIVSLSDAEVNAIKMIDSLENMKSKFL